jgi:hypothetical protein
MKINKKALELIEKGLSSKTVSKLDESQINTLHKKLFVEQINVSKSDTATIAKLKSEKKPFQMYEKEIDEDADLDDSAEKDSGFDPYAGNSVGNNGGPSSDDGFGGGNDGMGMMEEKDGEPNPWAICHAQVGPKKTRKFERCVQSVKKQLGEGKNPVSLFIENQIMRIVEKNLPPRITKGDLVKYLSEGENFATKHLQSFGKSSDTKTAPTKPTTKPGTKPQRPSHPGKNPNPGENPAPKAEKKKNEVGEDTKTAPTKPTTKPGTKPQRPSHPGKNPNPGENPAPKAKKPSAEETKDKVIDVILNLLQK